MVGQLAGPHPIVSSCLRVEERLERHLGVHDDGVVARQVDDEIGAEPPGVRERGRLQIEVAVLQHARKLHHLAKLDFAPLAAYPGERRARTSVLRFHLELLLRLPHGAEQRSQRGGVVDTVLVGLGQCRGHLREGVPDGRDHRVERLLALTELRGGGAVDVADLLVGELEELAAAGRQRRRGQGRKRIPELLLHLLDERQLLGNHPVAMRELGAQPGVIGLQGRCGVGAAGPRDQPPQKAPERKSENGDEYGGLVHPGVNNLEAV